MPLTSLKMRPGLNSVLTPSLNEGGWSAASNVRFFQGLPQKDAGFVQLIGNDAAASRVRALRAWEDLLQVKWLGIAGEDSLKVWDGTTLTDVTPVGWGSSPLPTLDNWGEFLMACDPGGEIYVWKPPPIGGVATAIGGDSPAQVNFIFVATQEQQLVALGATDAGTGDFDPMLVRWCDVTDFTTWTPTATNQAGSFRLANGSMIQGGLALYGQNLIWTDTCVYSMQYIQPPLVYGFQPLGLNVGTVGPHAVGILAGIPYWLSQNQFFSMEGGAPKQIECPVWDQVFAPNVIDRTRLAETACRTDTYYGEVGWSVPIQGGTGHDFILARLHVATGAWTCSTYHADTAWIDQNVFGAPISGDLRHDGTIAVDQHDIGYDAEGAAAPWSLTSGMIMIAEGDEVTFIRDFIPDIQSEGTDPSLSWLFNFYDYPNSTPRVKGPYVTNQQTKVIHPRGRGRQFTFTVSGDDLGTFARLGNIRVRAQPDGRRS